MKKTKRLVSLLIITVIFCTLFLIDYSHAAPSPNILDYRNTEENYVPGQLLVGMVNPVSLNSKLAADQFPGIDVLTVTDLTDVSDYLPSNTLDARSNIYPAYSEYHGRQILLVELASKDLNDMLKAISVLEQNPLVAYAELNLIGSACTVPNDPYFNYLWGMEKIQAPEAWAIENGDSDVLVGVMDTGMYYNYDDISGEYSFHPDLEGNVDISLGRNFCPGEDYLEPQDDYGHGTHVSGTIGANGNNDIGVVGVCPNVTIVPLKIWRYGSGSEAELISAIAYSEKVGIPILNLSGRWYPSWGVDMQAMYDAIEGYSGLLVCAAGNEWKDNEILNDAAYPASFDCENIISVAASNSDDKLVDIPTWGSNFGSSSVDLSAPGIDILSTVPLWYGVEYDAWGGTSMAAPHVSGAAALIKAHYPNITTAELKARILDNVDYCAGLDGMVATNGRLNVYKALDIIQPVNYYTISLQAGSGGSVIGGGVYLENTIASVKAIANSMFYEFDGWYENGIKIVNASDTYDFNVTKNRNLEARFTKTIFFTYNNVIADEIIPGNILSVEAKLGNPSLSLNMIVALYDENGFFIDFSNDIGIPDNNKLSFNVDLFIPSYINNGAYIRVFLWDALTFVPVCEPFIFPESAVQFRNSDYLQDWASLLRSCSMFK